MKWILGLIGFSACAICGLLGLTAGINLNPVSTVRYVPNWGSVGDWVSGVGALLAVVTTLILTRRSEEQQRILRHDKIEIEQGTSSTHVSIRFTSLGLYPAKVRSVLLVSADGGAVTMFGHCVDQEPTFPQRLDFKEDIQFVWKVSQLLMLVGEISMLEVKSLDLVKIQLITSTDAFDFPLQKDVCAAFRASALSHGITIEH
ncbi:hypothetical protein QF019_002463 [Pseudomonas frederiksbergensis]|uniref:hypothetical protein n=1 Tax=Pseudomonas frederiksbergensis TaxID=104087 RepID=UPI003D1A2E82